MTASERLRELATNQGGDDVTFTSAEVLVIASLVEAAETSQATIPCPAFGEPGFAAWQKRERSLTALRDALQVEDSSPSPPEGATALPICRECMKGHHVYCLDDGSSTVTCRCTCRDALEGGDE